MLAAPGCGNTSTKVGAQKPDPLEQFLDDGARALCESLERCCGEPEFSLDHCANFVGLAFWGSIEEARPGTYDIDRDQAEQCVLELRESTMCFDAVPASCELAVRSRLGAGESCRSNYECGHYFPLDPVDRCQFDGVAGHCFDSVDRGQACSGSCREDACHLVSEFRDGAGLCSYERGLRCDEGATCDALLPAGSACEEWYDCAPGTTCDLGVCEARVPVGGACAFPDECVAAARCEMGICTTWLTPGQACEPGAEGACDRPCLASGRCPGRYGSLCGFGRPQ